MKKLDNKCRKTACQKRALQQVFYTKNYAKNPLTL